MNHRLALTAITSSVICLLHPLPASATASSSAALNNITLQLFDLNPMDSFSPSVTFSGGLSFASSSGFTSQPFFTGSGSSTGPSPFGSVTDSTTSPFASSTGQVSGGTAQTTFTGPATFVLGSLLASGSALGSLGVGGTDSSSYSSGAGFSPGLGTSFTLSPMTLLTISGLGSTSAAITQAWNGQNYEQASASVGFQLSGINGSNSQSSSDGKFSFFSSLSNNNGLPGSDHQTGTIFTSFTNGLQVPTTGTLFAQANADGLSFAAAVPEPGSTALFLAGLGAIGFLSRRRHLH